MKNPLIRIHGAFPYDRGGKARWLMTELKLPYEEKWLDTQNGGADFQDPAFLKLNPMGRIPVLEIADQPMFESGAIIAYLADRFMAQGLAPAVSAPERATYEQWMYFGVATFDSLQSRIMIVEDIPAGELRTTKETAIVGEFRDAVATLDHTLSRNSFLVGKTFSAADISVSFHLYWCTLWPEFGNELKAFPSVTAYLERMKTMPSAVASKVFSYE